MRTRHKSSRRGGGHGKNGCFSCGENGHLARDCPSKGRSGNHRHQGGNAQTFLPRNDERRFFDKLTKSEDSEVRSAEEAKRLMVAALAFAASDGAPALLYRLIEDAGSSALRKCMEFITEPILFEEGFLPLIERLAQEDLNKPVYEIPMNTILSRLYQLPFLVPSIKYLIAEWIPRGQNDKRTSLAWFFAKICVANEDARKNKDISTIADELAKFCCGDHLQVVLGGNCSKVSLSQIRDTQTESPGGRHDNDKEDFRSINIIPTCQEFLCDAVPYLPAPLDNEQVTEASSLDRQFRLLREDIIGPSKDEMDDPKKQQRDIFYGARPIAIEAGTAVYSERGSTKVRVIGETDPCIMFQVKLPTWFRVNSMKSKKEKEEYWEKNRRILPRDALVCLERTNKQHNWVPVRFGIIVRREVKELISNQPLVGIAFTSNDGLEDTLIELSDRSTPHTRLVVVSADLFAYQPILRGLQMMTEIPFKHELVHAKPSLPAEDPITEIPSSMKDRVEKLDTGQRLAVNNALTDRVVLIQGPPGTGKTFVGVLLAELLIMSTTHKILVVTFTNHALDDFLEDLLDAGITDIVRIGGRSRSERLSECNLRELGRSDKAPFTRDQTRRYAQLKEIIEIAEKDVTRLRLVISREIGEKWWRRVEPHLKTHHVQFWKQLCVMPSDIVDEDGFRTEGISGEDHLWKCWVKNKKPPRVLQERASGVLWDLLPKDRHRQKIEWQHEIYENERQEIALALQTIKTARDELKGLQQVTDAHILSKARVIGCTTTKAAMCKSLLSGVNAGIVLVEEAAEIMEAHVLTSLSPGAKRLIMIGDHQQLRPKCQHYPLTVESNSGIDLNRSLFERLAMAHPIATLGVQHRMHPDISSIPKLITYNNLVDAPAVSSHLCPRGLESRVIFINHTVPEDEQQCGALESVSKTNSHEREMIVKSVHYILKQGYTPDDIVVLTPYLGQMMKLQSDLAKHLDVSIDERDLNEARDHLRGDENFSTDLATAKQLGLQSKASAIRVATIDNYQGEESKIVLVSLVRSNERGQIGFLKEPERVNVMLSRARDCEIIIGNRATLEQARGSLNPLKGGALWSKIFSFLESRGQIFGGFPTTCQNHGTKAILKCPEDFEIHCKHGGCMDKCGKELGCGHPCQNFCHPGECSLCPIFCPDICSRGHPSRRRCGADVAPRCQRQITWRCPMNHLSSGPCYAGKFSRECQMCENLLREEDQRVKQECALNEVLIKEHKKLSQVKHELEIAQQTHNHHQELQTLEAELAIAQKSLDEVNSNCKDTEKSRQDYKGNNTNSTIVTKNVLTLLRRENPLLLSEFPSRYKDEFGTNISEDAGPRRKKPRKLKEILERLPCCEVLPIDQGKNNAQYRVRLREEWDDADHRLTENTEPPLKMRRPETPPEDSKNKASEAQRIDAHSSTKSSTFVIEDKLLDMPLCQESSNNVQTILPPLSAKQNAGGDDCDATVAHILRRYTEEGALKTDDLLDEMSNPTNAIAAIRFMIEMELDPGGSTRAPAYKESSSKLASAVCLTAKAIDLQQRFPLLARDFSQKAIELVCKDKSFSPIFPKTWIDELTSIIKSATQPSESQTPKYDKSSKSLSDAWRDIEKKDHKAPAVMRGSILPMIGLEAVKKSMVGMYHRIKLSQEQGDGVASSYNVRFEGNPGSGKTTIARHYGLFLRQLLILPEGSVFQETNGAKLIQGGVKGLQDLLKDVKQNGGGVIFVDEAYQLVSDQEGKKVLDFILPLAESLETEYGHIVWIFAGYKKPLEKLFEHNEGLPSRFPLRFIFEDFSDEELKAIFCDMMVFLPPQMKDPKKNKTQKHRSAKSSSFYQNSYNLYPPSIGSTSVCRFGFTWTYIQNSGWTDKYGNRTVDPDEVGTNSSKIVDTNGEMWVEENSTWKCSNGVTQDHYPGSPAPIKSSKRTERQTPFHCDELHLTQSIKRLGRRRDERGFGNARAVRVLFETVRDRQAIRLTRERSQFGNPDIYFLSKSDLLGPDVTPDSLKKSKAWTDLGSLEGLVPVKESVAQLFKLVLRNIEREKRGEEPLGVSLNRLFLGNPGTGKTSVAVIYGQILADLGLLSKGEVILKCASDFVGGHLGESEQRTQGILKSAEGCVLVIDEAYSLYTGNSTGSGTNDPYKTAVIDTIVEKVQAKPGADLAVVMIGYREEMENMLSHVNPGLSRRFQIDEAFHFPDFDEAALVRIMVASARERGVKLSLSVAKRAVRTLARSRARPHFGNAGAIDNLLSKGIARMQARDQREFVDEFVLEDFDYNGDGPDATTLNLLFDDLIGCKSVKEKMIELKSTVVFSQAQGKDAAASGVGFNYLFLGNPGTGKTTVARKMGKMFRALGLLPGDELVEAKASDLTTGFTGQAGKCTREILKKSLGGVLFIDEAYQLDPKRGGTYMSEAVDELVGALTEEEFKGKVLVILAGYNEDMENMLMTNPGLKSRFSERVIFEDFGPDAVVELLLAELKNSDVPFKSQSVSMDLLVKLAQRLIGESGNSFGNGRDVVTWANYVYKRVAQNFTQNPQPIGGIVSANSTLEDIGAALEQLLESRKVKAGGQSCSVVTNTGGLMEASAQMNKPHLMPKTALKLDVLEEEAKVKTKSATEGETSEAPQNIFDSIEPSVLKTLQKFIDDQGLGAEEGAKRLANITPTSKEFEDLVIRLKEETGLDYDTAKAKLLKWQSLQEDLEDMIEKEKTKSKMLGARPIWRCGVCGRADKPWIACYVAPFIVRYEKIPE